MIVSDNDKNALEDWPTFCTYQLTAQSNCGSCSCSVPTGLLPWYAICMAVGNAFPYKNFDTLNMEWIYEKQIRMQMTTKNNSCFLHLIIVPTHSLLCPDSSHSSPTRCLRASSSQLIQENTLSSMIGIPTWKQLLE